MEQQRKLEILAECDFSEWRSWQRAINTGKDPHDVTPGFGTILRGIESSAYYLADGYTFKSSEVLEIILKGYGQLLEYYAKVPFNQLDPTDDDFKFLFEYKEILDDLGIKINDFAEKIRGNEMKASRDWMEFNSVIDLINKLEAKNYRETVLKKNGIALSTPVTI